jgi:hypothetical protein
LGFAASKRTGEEEIEAFVVRAWEDDSRKERLRNFSPDTRTRKPGPIFSLPLAAEG